MSLAIARRTAPISEFLIPSDGHTLNPVDWDAHEQQVVWYGLPFEDEYDHNSGGTYKRCRVEAFRGTMLQPIGYLPLPSRYASAWTQLCYTIVYWLSHWRAWLDEIGKPLRYPKTQPASFVQDTVNNIGARLLQYLIIRRMIMEELLAHTMSKDGTDSLRVFDEFLIRDRFDWLWCDYGDVPKHQEVFLEADPVHPDNHPFFSEHLPRVPPTLT